VRVIERAEALLLDPRPDTGPEEEIRTKLLWCRLLVELRYVEMFESCEAILDEAIRAAQQLGYTQLQMLALDQRAVLRAQNTPPNWKGAITDSTQAAALALELLSRNADAKLGKRAERSFLASLLPILDRVVDLHVQGAFRLGQRHAQLLDEPIGDVQALLRDESPQGTFLRFGRVIHTFVEQSQALALAAARNAFTDGDLSPRKFVVALDGEARIVVDSYRAKMRPDAAILQYFVFGRHVVKFVYGRDFFDWHLSSVVDASFLARPEPAHRKLEDVLHVLRPWMQGELHDTDMAALAELQHMIWPPKIDAVLRKYKIRHLCIVPHDNLYRIPFGRLETQRGTLLQCYSTSIHPTGQLASASAMKAATQGSGRVNQAFIVGPKIDCAVHEHAAMLRAHGCLPLRAHIESFDGTTTPLRTLMSRLLEFQWLHFLCHGEEGSFSRSPALHIGTSKTDRLELSKVAHMQLARCTLVVLQSCWTGWLDHRRTNPVQGFPQAFCDAGARAVIAPLTKVPQTLAPIFSEVFYRALRFLPAEQALQRALSVLRRYGRVLLMNNPEAQEALGQHGGMDAFEYRYVGVTGLVAGHWSARWLGRLSFWWWEMGLRRLHKSSISRTKNRPQLPSTGE
jgi:hypothetical protein